MAIQAMEISKAIWVATAAGVIAHRSCFIAGEWHMQATAILFVHMAAHGLLWMTLVVFQRSTGTRALLEASLIFACYLISLFTSMLVYRLLFHRLCTFPGPVLARSSKLWHAWKVRYSKNHLLLDQLHRQYGDFVRTGVLTGLGQNLRWLTARQVQAN